MLWNWRHKFIQKIPFLSSKLQSFAAAHHFASPINCPTTDKNRPKKPLPSKPFSKQEQLKRSAKPTFLTPQSVQATLQNYPSDLTALIFFLWCAQQPHYFHDKPTFRHMVPVVSNLTQQYGSVKAIVQGLESVGCITKAQTLLLLMRIYWSGAMYDMVFESFEEMTNYGYIPNTYARNILMDVLFKIGRVDVGLKVLEETETPNFLSYSTAVCNLCRLGEVDNVKVVLRCMLKKGYYLNLETYQLVLNCFCKFGRLDEAFQLLGIMMVLGAPISVNVWSILIDGLCKSGYIEDSAYLLEKMIKIGCSPNIVTCTSLIKGFLESRMPGKAFEILGILESRGCFPDLVLCNVLIDCLSKMGWYNDAFEIFSSLRERKLIPDVYTFSSLVSTICLSKQFVLLPLLTGGLAVDPDLVVCNCLLIYFCKSGYPEGAVEFYNDMIDRGFIPDKYSYAGVLSALCRLGRINEAVNVYHGMIRSNLDIDAHVHTVIINGLIKSGNSYRAIRLFTQAAGGKFVLDAVLYNVVIDGLIKEEQLKEAYALFTEMKQMKIEPDKRSYNLILSAFCKDRNFDMINRTIQEIVGKNIELENNTYILMRNSGLLPQEEHVFLIDEHDTLLDSNDTRDFVELGTFSSEDLSDAAISVG